MVLMHDRVGLRYARWIALAIIAGFWGWRSPMVVQAAALDDAAVEQPAQEPGGDSVTAFAGVVGTKYLLVSSYACTIPGCLYEDAVVRYEGTVGTFSGVHASSINGAYGMVIHPRSGRLLIANSDANTITEHDARTGAFLRTFVTAGNSGLNAPQNMAFTAAGNLLVTSTPHVTTPNAINGILEFNGDTGVFVRVFKNGGTINPQFPEDCGDVRCIRGAGGIAFGPNGNLYVASNINHCLIELNGTTGAYVGSFIAARLVAPIGLTVRPGPLRPGNIIATSQWDDPNSTTDFQKLVEFDKTTRLPISTNLGVIATGVIHPTSLRWHIDSTSVPPNAVRLLITERLSSVSPNSNDRVKMVAESGTFVKVFTPTNDANLHVPTAMQHVAFGFASCDMDGDGDVDLRDAAAYQRCAKNPDATCLGVFDDDQTGTLGHLDAQICIARMAGPPFPCTTNGQCNDANPCTVDTCSSGTCVRTVVADGTSCSDSTFCDGAEVCRGGACSGPEPCVDQAHCDEAGDRCRQCVSASECEDNNACTNNTCNASGICAFTPRTGTCDDGNACTINDACSNGQCVGGGARSCNDSNICTTDSCDPASGCLFIHNDMPCNDNSVCTTESRCLLGVCRGMNPIDCNDNIQCTTDFCDPVIGCRNLNSTLPCDDHDPCTTDEVCNGSGTCVGVPLDCDDGIECTTDTCVDGECIHTPNHNVCQDNLYCNGTDSCDTALGCVHSGNPCAANPPCQNTCIESNDSCLSPAGTACPADGNPCTNDVCNGAGQCGVPNNASCNDGFFCNGTDTCSGGTCSVHSGDPCAGSCNPADADCGGCCNEAADNCTAAETNGSTCNDGLFCNGTDSCVNGACTVHSGDPCAATCNPADADCGGCCNETADNCAAAEPNGSACNDNLFCNGADTCLNGACTVHTGDPCAGGAVCQNVCNDVADNCLAASGTACTSDGNPCTTDVCNGAGTCGIANSNPCSDGNPCTLNDFCSGGGCQGGPGPDCPGQSTDCYQAACDVTGPEGNCSIIIPKPTGTKCDDGNLCTIAGTEGCLNGECVGGTLVTCPDPTGPCDGGEACEPSTGLCAALADPPAGTSCDADMDACTLDECDGAGMCLFDSDVVCPGPTGDCDAGQSCNPANGTCEDDPDPSGTMCEADGDLCTIDECDGAGACATVDNVVCTPASGCEGGSTCNPATGSCQDNTDPNGTPCDTDMDACTEEECDGFGACLLVNTVTCSGPVDACDGGQTCNSTSGACENNPDPNGTTCDTDGDACTEEECNGAGSCLVVNTVTCPGPVDVCDGGQSCNATTGMCENNADPFGTVCEADGDLCTIDECNGSGSCVTVDTETCTPASGCDGGSTCNPTTGDCDDNADPDGTPCNTDANLCTIEECNGLGACIPTGSVTCSGPTGPCDGGQSCNPATGMCEDNVDPTGACDDGEFCTVSDSCVAGACVGTPRPINTACNLDANACTIDRCDNAGECVFFGNVGCAGPIDECDGGQTCNPANGACVDNADPDGTPCDTDDNMCTQERCDGAGSCFLLETLSCPGPNGCVGGQTCNPDTGECEDAPDPNGTPCDTDGNMCTIEQCNGAGGCDFVGNVGCAGSTGDCDGGQFCNTGTGACEDFPDTTAGTPCDDLDSDLCTVDECDGAGDCVFQGNVGCNGPTGECDAGETCNPGTGSCEENTDPASGTSCDLDADACTIDECNGTGSCVNFGDVPCTLPQVCEPTTGTCEDP